MFGRYPAKELKHETAITETHKQISSGQMHLPIRDYPETQQIPPNIKRKPGTQLFKTTPMMYVLIDRDLWTNRPCLCSGDSQNIYHTF